MIIVGRRAVYQSRKSTKHKRDDFYTRSYIDRPPRQRLSTSAIPVRVHGANRRRRQEGETMFSIQQKRDIADKIQALLCATKHPELPEGEISFQLHVDGAEDWSYCDIRNNGAVLNPSVNPHNELQDRKHGT